MCGYSTSALSQSLPLQAEPFGDQACRPFFAGLLPEGQLRQRIAQQCQISRSNDFGLLAAIGGDGCVGGGHMVARQQSSRVSLWGVSGEGAAASSGARTVAKLILARDELQ